MPSTPIHFPAGSDWVHRGTVCPLTLAQARLALAACLLHTPTGVSISTEEPLRARLKLDSGRFASMLIEFLGLREGIGVRTTVEDVHGDDVEEVARIHDTWLAAFPTMAAAVMAAGVAEVV